MIISRLSPPLRAYSYRLGHTALKMYSPLNHLVFHLSFPLLISCKTESHSMSRFLKGRPFLLHLPLQLPVLCMSAIDASPRIYLGSRTGYSPPLIGCGQMSASRNVVPGWLQKNPVFHLRRLSHRRLRPRKVCYRGMRYYFLSSSCKASC
jgi:hypothetical protein